MNEPPKTEELIEGSLAKHPEILEALETMRRICAIDNARGRDYFENLPVYYPLRTSQSLK
jgi:hypothetical protein